MMDCNCRECRKIALGLLTLWWDDLHCLTSRERLLLGGYAGIIIIPLLALLSIWLLYGPTLEQLLSISGFPSH